VYNCAINWKTTLITQRPSHRHFFENLASSLHHPSLGSQALLDYEAWEQKRGNFRAKAGKSFTTSAPQFVALIRQILPFF